MENFRSMGGASVILGGQWGSEGKGAAAAYVAHKLSQTGEFFDIATTNAGAQAGHTSVHEGITRVVYHLPTVSLISNAITKRYTSLSYLNAGSIIDPEGLLKEIQEFDLFPKDLNGNHSLVIHPNAAIIEPHHRELEKRSNSSTAAIASTQKGVGEALAEKVRRNAILANRLPNGHPLRPYVSSIDLNIRLQAGDDVVVEVPQGFSLSLNGPFYPYTTSRNCTLQQGLADAEIHPKFFHRSMLVLRTYPIRVGNLKVGGTLIGTSGPCYEDQREMTWDEIGRPAEITTVTKRPRRIFTFSAHQTRAAMRATQPNYVYLTFCDYLTPPQLDTTIDIIKKEAKDLGLNPYLICQFGPTTYDVQEYGK